MVGGAAGANAAKPAKMTPYKQERAPIQHLNIKEKTVLDQHLKSAIKTFLVPLLVDGTSGANAAKPATKTVPYK